VGGVGALIDALVRGMEKFGAKLVTSSHVEEIVVEGGRAVGVRLRNGQVGVLFIFSVLRGAKARICCDCLGDSLSKRCHLYVQYVKARKAVVTNASMWDTVKLLPKDVLPAELKDRATTTPQCESFMHLHLGFDAKVSY
jgi:hypothetical protein